MTARPVHVGAALKLGGDGGAQHVAGELELQPEGEEPAEAEPDRDERPAGLSAPAGQAGAHELHECPGRTHEDDERARAFRFSARTRG